MKVVPYWRRGKLWFFGRKMAKPHQYYFSLALFIISAVTSSNYHCVCWTGCEVLNESPIEVGGKCNPKLERCSILISISILAWHTKARKQNKTKKTLTPKMVRHCYKNNIVYFFCNISKIYQMSCHLFPWNLFSNSHNFADRKVQRLLES